MFSAVFIIFSASLWHFNKDFSRDQINQSAISKNFLQQLTFFATRVRAKMFQNFNFFALLMKNDDYSN